VIVALFIRSSMPMALCCFIFTSPIFGSFASPLTISIVPFWLFVVYV
jgi:hypothetical protein